MRVGVPRVAVVAVLAGCSSVTVEGRVVDGLTGQPIPGPYKVKARSVSKDVALTCQYFDAEVGPDGKFQLEKLCTGTAYHLETDREDLWLVEIDEIPEGGFGQPTDLTAWRVPKGSGVYELSGGELKMLRTAADVEHDQVFGTDRTVRLPGSVPEQVDLIADDEYLVLVGKETIEEMKLVPLVPSGPRKFGTPESPYARTSPWWYLGVRFTDDSTIETVEAKLDPKRVIDKAKDERHGRFIGAKAVGPGRYALLEDDDKRMFLIDFGAPPPPLPGAGKDADPAGKDAAAAGEPGAEKPPTD